MNMRYLLISIMGMMLFIAGCSSVEGDHNENNTANENETEGVENHEENEDEESAAHEEDENEPEASDEDGDYRSDLGNLNIWFEAEVNVEEDQVTIEGESNLLPGSRITSRGVSDNFPSDDYRDETEVGEDGAFNFEFPGREDEIDVTLRLSTGRELVSDHYGDNLENATGNHVYKTSTSDEYESKYTFTIDPRKAMPHTIDLTKPDYASNVPADYGDTEVWMEVDATTEHNFLYFEGESNLVEGSQINGSISDPKDLISSAWSSSNAQVKPDGSFQLRIHYWDLREGMEMDFEFDPAKTSWENVVDAYGEDGEALEGDLVKRKDDGQKYIKQSVDLAGPEIDAPDDVDLSVEDEEIKLQVPDDLLFDFDKSKLKSAATATLDEIIEDLNDLPSEADMQINGHTDNEGEADYNLDLSEERAHAVADYINENSDLDSLTMKVQGFGETQPIAANKNEDEREKNRRVEIVINPTSS